MRSLPQPELSMSSVCGWSEPSLGELPMESWMSHLPCALWDIPLSHLAIPGRLLPATASVPKVINRWINHKSVWLILVNFVILLPQNVRFLVVKNVSVHEAKI